jgi:LmbE family N-acetylglucosaminyl deacetylase
LADAARSVIELAEIKDGFSPYQGADIKTWFEGLKRGTSPDVILCHSRSDAHLDRRQVSILAWNTFRDCATLGYEIPRWDGDLSQPNVSISASRMLMERKARLLREHFARNARRIGSTRKLSSVWRGCGARNAGRRTDSRKLPARKILVQ